MRRSPTLFWAVLLFLGLSLGAEALLGQEPVRARLPIPGVGGGYYPFDEKLFHLEQFAREHDTIDCFFLGSSMGETALNPAVFQAAYAQQTGEELTCFNFSVVIMTASTVGDVAAYLVRRYQPRLLVYGISTRDLNKFSSNDPQERDFPQTAWMRYQGGERTPAGWLVENSVFYRYIRSIPEFLEPSPFIGNRNDSWVHFRAGYRPLVYFAAASPLLTPPTPLEIPFVLSTEDAAGLEKFLRLADNTALFLVEVPMFTGAGITYVLPNEVRLSLSELLQQEIGSRAAAAGVPFWETTALDIAHYWTNQNHMQVFASYPYSQWVGWQVGAAMMGRATPPAVTTLDTRIPPGMSPALQDAYREHLHQTFDLIPADAIILEPSVNLYSRPLALGALDFLIQDGVTTTPARRQHLFDLRAVLERARFADELRLSAAQESALANWRHSKEAHYLHQAGIDYLLYTSLWYGWLTPPEIAALHNADAYEEIATWRNFPIGESVITLLRIKKATSTP